MNKFITFNSNGVYDSHGFTPDDLASNQIPCTEEQYANPWNYKLVAGQIVPVGADVLLDNARAEKSAELNAACAAEKVGGVISSALGSANTYPTSLIDQANLDAAVTSSLFPSLPSGWTTPLWVQDSAGEWSYVEHTKAQVQTAGADVKSALIASSRKLIRLNDELKAAGSFAAIQSITF